MLAGRADGDLKEVSLQLGARILKGAGAAASVEQGAEMLASKIDSGEGLRKFAEMIRAQGGDPRVTEDTSLLPKAKSTVELRADEAGYLAAVRTADVGNAAKLLGAGRERKTDEIDPAVGVVMHRRVGDKVRRGDLLATLHVGERSDRIGAYNLLRRAMRIGPDPSRARR